MELVRKTIQNENFKSLLDLSFGSALAIALDTSESMTEEKDAVLAEITEIINAISTGEGVEPSVYILGLYEKAVDLTITQNGQEIIDKLANVNVIGGVENVFTAIQVGDYSNIT